MIKEQFVEFGPNDIPSRIVVTQSDKVRVYTSLRLNPGAEKKKSRAKSGHLHPSFLY
jgi:hypothetical protein